MLRRAGIFALFWLSTVSVADEMVSIWQNAYDNAWHLDK